MGFAIETLASKVDLFTTENGFGCGSNALSLSEGAHQRKWNPHQVK